MASWRTVLSFVVGVGLLVIGPLAIAHGFLFLEHQNLWRSQEGELFFCFIAPVAIGVAGVWFIPVKGYYVARGLASALYACGLVVALFVTLTPTYCEYFGECL